MGLPSVTCNNNWGCQQLKDQHGINKDKAD